MLICFSSDHHHGVYSQFARTLPDGVNSRLAEGIAVEYALHTIMKERGVILHVRAGDLMEQKNVIDAVVASLLGAVLRKNTDAGIQEIILGGNHDTAHAPAFSTIDIFRTRSPDDSIQTVTSSPQSWMSPEGVSLKFVPYTVDITPKDFAPTTDDVEHSVLVTHVGVRGARTGSEYLLPSFCSVEDLYPDQWKYVILGHIHEPQEVVLGHVMYVGSLFQRNFADEGSRRRVLLLDTTTMKLTSVPLPGPQFHTVYIGGPEDVEALDPIISDYYRVVLQTRDVTVKHIDAAMDGRCAGWSPAYDVTRTVIRPRLSTAHRSWVDVCTEYVKQVMTSLNRDELITTAQECMHA